MDEFDLLEEADNERKRRRENDEPQVGKAGTTFVELTALRLAEALENDSVKSFQLAAARQLRAAAQRVKFLEEQLSKVDVYSFQRWKEAEKVIKAARLTVKIDPGRIGLARALEEYDDSISSAETLLTGNQQEEELEGWKGL